ncbi:MAG: zinc ribbon domain-containing protein [Actinobacteria bacterium]|nr:zinc ribbon domain-containing protein [Actinomycetota bacterium]
MPTYEYRCRECEHQFERFQKMSDEPVSECEICSGEVRKLLFPVAIHFKGSGFYTTDYAKKKTLAASNGNGSNGNGSASCDSSSEASQASEKSVSSKNGDSSKVTSAAGTKENTSSSAAKSN